MDQLFDSRRKIRVLPKMLRKEVGLGSWCARGVGRVATTTSPSKGTTALATATTIAVVAAILATMAAASLNRLINLATAITFAFLTPIIGLSSSKKAIIILLVGESRFTCCNAGSILGCNSSKLGKFRDSSFELCLPM